MAIGTPINGVSFNAALKEITPIDYIQQQILLGAKDPLYNLMDKKYDAGGYQWRLPVATSTNVRVGANFAAAQSTNSNAKNQAFLVTYSQIYAVASWSGPVLQQSMGDKNAFESVLTQEMDLAIAALNNKIATQVYRSGTGSITQLNPAANVSASNSGGTQYPLQLLNSYDVLMFEVGDLIVFSAADGSALRTGAVTVTGIDLSNGNLLASTTWSTAVTGLAVTDFVYRCAGDASNGSTAQVMAGFLAWCPPSATSITSGDSFFGVNRSTYKSKLAGLYYDNTALQDSIAEALVNACSLLQAAGARDKFDTIILHPQEMKKLVNDTSSKVVVGNAAGGIAPDKAKIGLSNFNLLTDFGPVKIEQSIFAVPGIGFLASSSTWHMLTSGKPGVQEVDGIMALRVSTDDAYEARLAAVNIAVGCNAPGWNMAVRF